ncbi:conserved protein of unknown function [Pseudomonas marincola]|uniref:Uncharacterized protein n=1 Tax=Pseudomonas marincola TaxID=437900 RepID=A0A653E370_9PSED|nr:conserved protein of unknown function [Pseudomonas marincola]
MVFPFAPGFMLTRRAFFCIKTCQQFGQGVSYARFSRYVCTGVGLRSKRYGAAIARFS